MDKISRGDGIIIRGKQRRAVYDALDSARTGKQLLAMAKEVAPSITFQDLRHILRSFEGLGLVRCLNPQDQSGRIYIRIDQAHRIAHDPALFAICGQVGRGSIRMAVLSEIAREKLGEGLEMTATGIRKNLRASYSISLNHILASLQFLHAQGLVQIEGHTRKRWSKIYSVTSKGQAVLNLLQPDIHGSSPHT